MSERDSSDIAREFSSFSTQEMLRVARIVTPPSEAYKWTATSPGVTWKREGGSWKSANPEERGFQPHDFDDDWFRYLLGEQLAEYDVTSYSDVWWRY